MVKKLEVKVQSSSYENLVITCPDCKQKITYNRATDLRTLEPIGGSEVDCLNCNAKLWVSGDSITPLYWDLLYECESLFIEKKYMFCILNICQAYEVFFLQYIKVVLVYKIFQGKDHEMSYESFENTLKLLLKKLKNSTFFPLRKIFLILVLKPPQLDTLEDAKEQIENINDVSSFGNHYFEEYQLENRDQIIPYLLNIWESNIGNKRNDVTHKHAYRPTKDEVETLLKDAKKNILNLESVLKVSDDFWDLFFYT